jgi:hypothetical protein
MTSGPLFTLEAAQGANVASMIKAAMCGSAVMIAGLGAALPWLMHTENMLLTGVMLAVAASDLVLAFVLPPIIAKQMATECRFFHDRMVMNRNGREYVLSYENIETVSDETPAGSDAVTVVIATRKPHGIAPAPQPHRLILSSLSPADSPYDKIKEVVEKYRNA